MYRVLLALSFTFMLATAVSAGDLIEERPGWVVRQTSHAYADLVERVNGAVKESPLNIVTRASATVGAKNVGRTIPGNMVVGIYGPKFAVRMLDASVQAGIEAPIRLYITEAPDGVTTLSYRTPSYLFGAYEDDGGSVLMTMADELDGIFAAIVDKAAGE